MAQYWSVGHRIPKTLRRYLYGDRERWGLTADAADAEWQRWQGLFVEYYDATQKDGLPAYINDLGYAVLERLDLTDKVVLEIGPGDIGHTKFWRGKPKRFIALDTRQDFLDRTIARLEAEGVSCEAILVEEKSLAETLAKIEPVDVVLSFYALEHIYPLAPYLKIIQQAMRPGAILAGAIPTEGGFAWGVGRFCTSRRWVSKTYKLDYDKIICWEHPNFADSVMNTVDNLFEKQQVHYQPFRVPLIDPNFVISFIYRNGPEPH